jgi:hypothetical protein
MSLLLLQGKKENQSTHHTRRMGLEEILPLLDDSYKDFRLPNYIAKDQAAKR